MSNLANHFVDTVSQLLGKLFTSKDQIASGINTALDGNTAIAITEASISEAAGLGASFPANCTEATWINEQQRLKTNVFGGTLSHISTQESRAAFAAAIGQSLSGLRSTSFMSGPDLANAQDLLSSAIGHHLPLIIHLYNRALSGQASSLNSDHEVYHKCADSGCFLLIAKNVQQAVDFTLIARRTAELTLIPGIVAMDWEQTANAFQEVSLIPLEVIHQYLGSPQEKIATPTQAQQLLFGAQRDRIPGWHNLDRPVLVGGIQEPHRRALGNVAQHVYFESALADTLDESFALFAKQTGRQHQLIDEHQLDDAQHVMICQGALTETAMVVADYLRHHHKLKFGVLGMNGLRPFPAKALQQKLSQKKSLIVLEHITTTLAEHPPLLREIKANNNTSNPKYYSVIAGLSGLQAKDLVEFCTTMDKHPSPTYLGIDFSHRNSPYPKRQALLDTLNRHYPDLAKSGINADCKQTKICPQDSITVAVYRNSASGNALFAIETATFMQKFLGGQLRSRHSVSSQSWDSYCIDHFTHATHHHLYDPGDLPPVDILVLSADCHATVRQLINLRHQSLILIESQLPSEDLWQTLPTTAQTYIKEKQLQVYRVDCSNLETSDHSVDTYNDTLMGGLFAILLEHRFLDHKPFQIHVAREESLENYPDIEQEECSQAFKSGFENVQQIHYQQYIITNALQNTQPEILIPAILRNLESHQQHYDSLPRFWDQSGILYQNNEQLSCVAEPYMATSSIPPLSASFRSLVNPKLNLPLFDPLKCTGCGDCWSRCPDGAIAPLAISSDNLLDAAIKITGASSLRQISGKLATRMHNICKNRDMGSAGELLDAAYQWLSEKMPMAEDRKAAIESDFQKVRHYVGDLPVSCNDVFYKGAESQKKDGGELLSVVINPDNCKNCGLCIHVCEAQALSSIPQSDDHIQKARQQWRIWEQLPDTSSNTIERLYHSADLTPLAAVLLSRYFLLAMTGGDGAEAASGEKIAVRFILSINEFLQQPRVNQYLTEIETHRQQLVDLIKETLAQALNTNDLDALATKLELNEPLEKILHAESEVEDSLVNIPHIQVLIQLAESLKQLHWQLAKGNQGLGRARAGLAITPGSIASWAGHYPYNPFMAPVVVENHHNVAQLSNGLLTGQLQKVYQGFNLMRQAHAQLDTTGKQQYSEVHSWQDLTETEQKRCPPLILIGHDEILGGKNLSQVMKILQSDHPLKVIALANLDFGIAAQDNHDTSINIAQDPPINIAIQSLTQGRAFIAQTSIADQLHYYTSVKDVLNFPGSALMHVYVPSPKFHGFASDQTYVQAELARQSRAFPLFTYHPHFEGVFGSRINLDNNPEITATWDQNLTPAHWAINEKRFRHYFSPLGQDESNTLELTEYLALDSQAQQKKIPFIKIDNHDETTRYRVAQQLVKVCAECAKNWRILQELAGYVTPFTQKIEKALREKIAGEHAEQMAQLKNDYEQKIEQLKLQSHDEVAAQLKQRLLNLAGYQ